MNSKVDKFLDSAKKWQKEMKYLREICLESGLNEDFKWMHPCYDLSGKNVVLIHNFKEYCALLFHKGVLLNDSHGFLIQQTENVQSARQLRFTNLQEIIDLEQVIKAYIYEAIELEKAGVEVVLKKTSEFEMPEEFKNALENNASLKTSFYALTPGRQRGYLLYFAQAKQPKTREARIEKCTPDIMNGKGLND